jgi:hypothetical protein
VGRPTINPASAAANIPTTTARRKGSPRFVVITPPAKAPTAIKPACPNENSPVIPLIRFRLAAKMMFIPIK